MKVEHREHTSIIKHIHEDVATFANKILHEMHQFKDKNLIIDITNFDVTTNDLKEFLELTKFQKKAKKSCIIVASNIDFNAVSTKIQVVPTIQEAHDLIEMDEITRDLGF